MLNRLLYLGYYFKEMDWRKFNKFMHFVRQGDYPAGKHRVMLWKDMLSASLRYNISLLDYFYFRFYEHTDPDTRKTYAGTGFLYEYQRRMNPPGVREILEDKIRFLNTYRPFVRRQFYSRAGLTREKIESLYATSPAGKVVVKGSRGQVGAEVHVLDTAAFAPGELLRFMDRQHLDLIEEYVLQHPELMRLSPSGLNTVRIFTQLQGNDVHILGARLRITLNAAVDNMAAGNMAAVIDVRSGRLSLPAVFSDITRKQVCVHPVTGVEIPGFQVPNWEQVIQLANALARVAPENRSVGWDIAVTREGCEVIEGNHNWCKLLWQLPEGRGLKDQLTPYLH